MRSFTHISLLLTSLLLVSAEDSFESACASLAQKYKDGNTTIYASQYYAKGGTFELSNVDAACKMMTGANPLTLLNPNAKPKLTAPTDLCRVAAYTATTDRSGVNFELWMPKEWSGRFFSEGNGGLSGCEYFLQSLLQFGAN
jgi:feruloyl esterase